MEVALGKYQIIDSNSQKTVWNRNDRLVLKGILFLLLLGIGIAISGLLDRFLSKDIQYFLIILIPIMLTFLLYQIRDSRKPFIYTNQDLYFYPNKIVIKSKNKKEIQIDDIKKIDFSYSCEDSGFYHPIFNSKRQRGNMNFISINLGNETIRMEIYLPKKNEKIRLDNIMRKYEDLIRLKI